VRLASQSKLLNVKLENLIAEATQRGLDFDSVFEVARTLELLSEGELDELTDQVARGGRTEEELLAAWTPMVLDAAALQRPKLECVEGRLRPGCSILVHLDDDPDPRSLGDVYGDMKADELLTLGRAADFAGLRVYASLANQLRADRLRADPTPCEQPDTKVAAGIARALAAQGVWGASAPPSSEEERRVVAAVAELQPLAIALRMRAPKWLSHEQMLFAAALGFVIPAKPAVEFRSITSWRVLHPPFPRSRATQYLGEVDLGRRARFAQVLHLLPFLKAALEPTGKPVASVHLGRLWLRARLAPPQGRLAAPQHFGYFLLLEAMHAAVRPSFDSSLMTLITHDPHHS
jgi:hypothetical protein